MKALVDLFPGGESRGAEARQRLAGAYNRVFFNPRTASPEDAELVLTDMAASSRYFFADGKGLSADEMREANGKRWFMARIVRLGMGEGCDLSELYDAVSRETAATNTHGDI